MKSGGALHATAIAPRAPPWASLAQTSSVQCAKAVAQTSNAVQFWKATPEVLLLLLLLLLLLPTRGPS
jgi:hypothetical protein